MLNTDPRPAASTDAGSADDVPGGAGPGAAAVSVRGVDKRFGELEVLRSVDPP